MDKDNFPVDIKITAKEWDGVSIPFTTESVPLEFNAKGCKIPSWGYDRTGMTDVLPDPDSAKNSDVSGVTLIPMGAARLRISAFPKIKLTGR